MFDAKEKADRPAKCGVNRGAANTRLRRTSQVVPGVEGELEAGKWRHKTFVRGGTGTNSHGFKNSSHRKKLDLPKACKKKRRKKKGMCLDYLFHIGVDSGIG